VASLCHPWFTTTNLSYRFPIFETSATALCGTTGIFVVVYYYLIIHTHIYIYVLIYIYLYLLLHRKQQRRFSQMATNDLPRIVISPAYIGYFTDKSPTTVSSWVQCATTLTRKIYTLKIKQTPLSGILEPRIWGLKSFSLKKPKVSQFVNGDHVRTPKCTEG